ncbi:histidine kinase [Terriglobus sp.]|uniref:histidine kinase n=1 Tax=Terriglobus sp. TaxID=1889013 RepID=UPI003AFF7450
MTLSKQQGKRTVWSLALLALLIATVLSIRRHVFEPRLPYDDSFARGNSDEWKAFGGTWELVNGSMRNDSDERGAKLLTGSSHWSNYSIEADVMLLGLGGDAGLMLRTSDEETGVDAYTGYYAGLRTLDNTLLIGRAGYGWVELNEKLKLGTSGVRASQWYHLKLLAYGCQLAATATLLPEGESTTMAVTDDACLRTGRAGLRSYASGGVWRNIQIREAKQADLAGMQALSKRHPPALDERFSSESQLAWNLYASAAGTGFQMLPPSPNVQAISSLRMPSPTQVKATIRGAVVLASPALYVQDSSGGIAVQQIAVQPLKVGDEVEVTGTVRPGPFSSTLEQATVRVLWENTPVTPLSVTASQAATGAFDATFVEVEGRLADKQRGPDDSSIFTLDAGPQSFRAVMNRGRGNVLYAKLKPGSMLRLRGVAVASSTFTMDMTPFALLLRSSDDAVVLAGPPWWSTGHVLEILAALLLLALVAVFVYHRVESWRLRAVLEERERMAYEMHDTLSQSFAGIGFQLNAIRESMPGNLPRLRQQLDLASDLVRHSHEETRRSIAVLRPEQPGSIGLLPALQECANRLVEGGSVRVVASSMGDIAKVPLRIADAFYHIGQESLANAVRHADPQQLQILLTCEKGEVQLRVLDDGDGFYASDDLPGFGLRGMQKRAASIGAQLQIRSAPGNGTEVLVRSGLKRSASKPPPGTYITNLWRQLRHVGSPGKFHPDSDR